MRDPTLNRLGNLSSRGEDGTDLQGISGSIAAPRNLMPACSLISETKRMSAGRCQTSRRRVVQLLGGLGVAWPLNQEIETGEAETTTGESWPQWVFDPQNTGRAPTHSPPGPRAGVRWRFEPEELSSTDIVVAAPVVRNGLVYIGDTTGTLNAIDVGSGRRQWKKTIAHEGDVTGPAATLGPDRLYVSFPTGWLVALESAPRPTPTATRTETITQESMTNTSAAPARTTDTVTTPNPDSTTAPTTTNTGASGSGDGSLTTVLGAAVVLLVAFVAALWRRLRGEEGSL